MIFRLLLILLMAACTQSAFSQKVISIAVDGPINPAVSDFIERGIQKAEKENAACLLIKLNTPGGLLQSTRTIVGDILDAPVPVVVYVSPAGSHAGSAGVFITMAGHIAAMAPGTNIGAAHPVNLQGGMDSVSGNKAVNDAAAFIRTIAERRNRNLEWAEDAVRNSVSITASEALRERVIDTIANSVGELLEMINGQKVMLSSGIVTLRTAGASVEEVEMSFIEKLLHIISDPNIAYILMMLGFYGLLFELYSPGTMLPGIIGGICLILAFYSLNTLPVNYAGLALIVFGIILFLLEIKVTSHGLLAIGGTISLLLGSFMLLRDDSSLEFVRISRVVIITVTACSALFFLFVVGAGLKAQKGKSVSGMEGLIAETGIVIRELSPLGTIMLHGEIWEAESGTGNVPEGTRVRVVSRQGFRLLVEPIQTTEN